MWGKQPMAVQGCSVSLAARGAVGAVFGCLFAVGTLSAAERLSPFTPVEFVPDGRICEFIHLGTDCQAYFEANLILAQPPTPHPNFGAVRSGAVIPPGVYIRRDNSPSPINLSAAGQAGFFDLPGVAQGFPLPTGFNIGRVMASYNPYAYPTGSGFEGAYFLAMDVSAPGSLDQIGQTQSVAFDVDGDGSLLTHREIGPDCVRVVEAPLSANKFNREGYILRINTDRVGINEIGILIGEQVESLPDGAIEINGPCCSGVCRPKTGAACPFGMLEINGACCNEGACAPRVGACPPGTTAQGAQCCTAPGPPLPNCDRLYRPESMIPPSPNALPPHVIGEELDGEIVRFCVRRYVLFKDNTTLLPGTDEEQALEYLDANDDGYIDHLDFGVGADVELVVRKPHTLPRSTAPTCPLLTFIADSFDDVCLGGGEDAIILSANFPVAELEVIKEARCVDNPESVFSHDVRAVPGSEIEFRITIQNHGNRALDVLLTDALSCASPAMLTPLPGSCRFASTPPTGIVPDLCQRFEAALNKPDGFPLPIGRLPAFAACAARPGPALVFTFRARVGPPCPNDPACGVLCDEDIDCLNAVSVEGTLAAPEDQILAPYLPDANFGPDGNSEEEDCTTQACCNAIPNCAEGRFCTDDICAEVSCPASTCSPAPIGGNCATADCIGDVRDEYFVTVFDVERMEDTPRERLTGDDNVVNLRIECRGIDLTKEVRLSPNGVFQTGSVPVDLPPLPPVEIEYRYTIANRGEVDERVELDDRPLCEGLATVRTAVGPAAVTFLDCGICTAGGRLVTEIAAEGGMFQSVCRLRLENDAALRALTRIDDARSCRADAVSGLQQLCFKNCATATATPTDFGMVCPAGAIEDRSESTLCYFPCDVAGVTQTRCLDNCDDKTAVGVSKDLLLTTRDSCIEYVSRITNSSPDVPLCRLLITDELVGQPNCIQTDGAPRFVVVNEAGAEFVCPVVPSGFNVNGIPFAWNPVAHCGGRTALNPRETLRITFNAMIPVGAPLSCGPLDNRIRAEGASNCRRPDQPVFACDVRDTTTIDLLEPSLACRAKEWSVEWDGDADCLAEAPASGFARDVDLRDKVFPIRLTLRVRAENTGQVPLEVVVADPALRGCVNSTPGVSICNPAACQLDSVSKILGVGKSDEWTCAVCVATAAAMRALDACDGTSDGTYVNRAAVMGRLVRDDTNICVPEEFNIPGAEVGTACEAKIRVPRPCDFSVSKQVKCADDTDAAYTVALDAVPGGRMTYRIQVANNDTLVNIPRVCIDDDLNCLDWLVAGSCRATIAGADVSACVCPGLGAALPTGARRCYTFAPCRAMAPWIGPTETLTITFDVDVPDGFNRVGIDPDCTNRAVVEGYSEVCVPSTVPDAPCDIGTSEARIDVLISDLNCEERIAADHDNNGQADAGDAGFVPFLSLPCDTPFPYSLIYRFRLTNKGETPLTNVQVCDPKLVADATAAGLTVQNCAVTGMGEGCGPLPVLPIGGSVTGTCRVMVPSRAAWERFAGRDADNEETCYTNISQGRSRVDAQAICDFGADITVRSESCAATACLEPLCAVVVENTAQCVENCQGDTSIGAAKSLLPAAPGSCVQFSAVIRNTHPELSLCRLRITNSLMGQPDHIVYEDDLEVRCGRALCPVPPGFNLNGTPFELNPAACSGVALPPNGVCSLTFKARVPETANPNFSPRHDIRVEGAPTCRTGEPADYCCEWMDFAEINILRPGLECMDKTWSYLWDRDTDCDPDGPPTPFDKFLDLRDKVFPVDLRLLIRAKNIGEVPLRAMADDPVLRCLCSKPGVTCAPATCRLDETRLIGPDQVAEWRCDIRVETAEAMRSADTCDGRLSGTYQNTVTISGLIVRSDTNSCIPSQAVIAARNMCFSAIQIPDPCEFDVEKQVKCRDDVDTAYTNTIESIPGSVSRFRVQVTNLHERTKIPRICGVDELSCANWLVEGSCRATLAEADVTPCVCPAIASMIATGQPQCATFPACRAAAPWIAPGETLIITFDVSPPDAEEFVSASDPDCTNRIRLDGYAKKCVPFITSDRSCDQDTAEASIDVVNSELTCTKEAAADFNRDGTVDTPFSQALTLPCDTRFPLDLFYRFTVRNAGETALRNVSICDGQLRADALAAGLEVGPCILTEPPGECGPIPALAPGASQEALCRLRIADESRWRLFAQTDGDAHPLCYANQSAARADVGPTGVCDDLAEQSVESEPCEAVVCLRSDCDLTVAKNVRCLDNCIDRNRLGGAVDGLAVAPGSCVEFEVTITNRSTSDALCRLRITDAFSAGSPANIIPNPGSVRFRMGTATCPVPAGFNLSGTPFEFNPRHCTGGALAAGGTVVYTYSANVVENPNPDFTPIYAVLVEGAPTCSTGPANFCCRADDDTSVDLLRPGLSCRKEWAYEWDSNADCIPGPASSDFGEEIDLRDKIFPVALRMRVRANNTGEVPLEIRAYDASIACVCSSPHVTCSPQNCGLGQPRTVAPNATGEWSCEIVVDKASAMRALDSCDGSEDGSYLDTVSVHGKFVAGNTAICVPENVRTQSSCASRIRLPEPCDLEVSKTATCVDGCFRGSTTGQPAELLDHIARGAFARFTVSVTNTSALAKTPRVCFSDLADCETWACGNGAVSASLAGQDVSSCLGGFEPDGNRRCFTFGLPSCRPAAPWIAPGETLAVSFEVQVPEDFDIFKKTPDCVNAVSVELLSEVCPPEAKASCGPKSDTALLDIKLPRLETDRSVSVDIGNDGSTDLGGVADMHLANPSFPMKVIHTVQARNTGELPLLSVTLCDTGLVKDALAAGIRLTNCGFCDSSDCGSGGFCREVGTLLPGGSASLTCELIVEDDVQWDALGDLDRLDDRRECYTSMAQATGRSLAGCLSPGFDALVMSEPREAQVCISVIRQCPKTMATFDIWNQNEVRLSGTRRCIPSWDQTFLSRYTGNGITNNFLRSSLQTVKGRARIDGVSNPIDCGGESTRAPLIGVSMKVMNFGRNGVDYAGGILRGVGAESGFILHEPGGAAAHAFAVRAHGVKTELELPAGFGPALGYEPAQTVASESDQGSLLVFPNVEVKWDSLGQVIQDTFVSLVNDSPEDVFVQLYFVNGDPARDPIVRHPPAVSERGHPGCNSMALRIELTGHEPNYWSALTGQPKGVAPWTQLDAGLPPGRPDDDPRNVGGRELRGYILAWAVNESGQEVRWNHLQGTSLIINYRETAAWEYSAVSFKAVGGVATGNILLEPIGRLDLDGNEYDSAPETLLFDFFAAGSVISSAEGHFVTFDTNLTLWVAVKDFR